ncbi:MAG: hypothetical protein L0332_19065 [Chloroflexi bacterium]|nr:hypothetical protein [Chloroflexota bacterium]MCI0576291.1 hypothetical protein [Chloroflexota bacterium]MCI0644513.1 hypothetical protein [Chloroflexota bacterium]MCI0728798.1 hypothetical protein [Chloroflexota bacterium]
MSGRRLVAVFLIIIAVLIIVVVGVVFRLQQPGNGGGGDGTPAAEGTGVPAGTPTPTIDPNVRMVEVVVSQQTVPRGWQITEAELAIDLRLASEVGSNVITRIEDAVGLYARSDIYQGETLTTDTLVRDPRLIGIENYGPSSLIPPGWEAIAIPMDRLSSVGYGLASGDSIDIMLSFHFHQIDEEFRTYLQNRATFVLVVEAQGEEGEEGQPQQVIFVIDPYGRFEALPNGDIVHISPREGQRPVPVSIVLQSARVIQVGPWTPPEPARPPTPTPDPNAPTPTPGAAAPTPTPRPPDVLLVALPPQQLLFLKYALEGNSDIDYALRGVNDGQLYAVQEVNLNYLIQQFGIEVPPDFGYSTDTQIVPLDITPTPGP